MEAKKWLVQRKEKCATKYFFIFYSWFSSNVLYDSSKDIGSGFIVIMKINTKGFRKDAINNPTKDWPGVY